MKVLISKLFMDLKNLDFSPGSFTRTIFNEQIKVALGLDLCRLCRVGFGDNDRFAHFCVDRGHVYPKLLSPDLLSGSAEKKINSEKYYFSTRSS